MSKTKRTPKPLTDDEKIDKAIHHLTGMRFVDDPIDPPTFVLRAGDEVELGGLKNPIVHSLRDEGRIVVLRYELTPTRDNPDRHGFGFGAWWWWDVVPRPSSAQHFATDPRIAHYSSRHTRFLISHALTKRFDDAPNYQRDYVWSLEDKRRFVQSLLAGRDLGKIILLHYAWPRNKLEILDGKQRIQCLADFVAGRFTYHDRYWQEFSTLDRNRMESRIIQVAEIEADSLTRSDILGIFLDANAAGVAQTEEHLIQVREMYEEALASEGKEVIA